MAKLIRAIKNIFGSKTFDPLIKLVGTDRFENKFYERLPGHRYYNSSRRFYEPANYSNVRLHIDPAWEAWLRGTRKDPPTLNETLNHEERRQVLAEKTIDMLPTSYGRNSVQGGTNSFPIRDEYETNPGSKSKTKSNIDETF